MKNLLNSAMHWIRNRFAAKQTINSSTRFFGIVFLLGLLMTGCRKDNLVTASGETGSNNYMSETDELKIAGNTSAISAETIMQLQKAKIATAKYNNFDNAIKEGYVDINVIVPEMGHHYLKSAYLDATFEYDKPEILVYNKEENGKMKLVALEYAVPINMSPNAPSGFEGTADVWSVYQGALWTLHAWVWENNPSGIFNPTNPLIHTH